jgi:hypothetical protein
MAGADLIIEGLNVHVVLEELSPILMEKRGYWKTSNKLDGSFGEVSHPLHFLDSLWSLYFSSNINEDFIEERHNVADNFRKRVGDGLVPDSVEFIFFYFHKENPIEFVIFSQLSFLYMFF